MCGPSTEQSSTVPKRIVALCAKRKPTVFLPFKGMEDVILPFTTTDPKSRHVERVTHHSWRSMRMKCISVTCMAAQTMRQGDVVLVFRSAPGRIQKAL
mmetsp:Transcript_46938/g.109747  ORF Transcript_46938/g.109747 Transcript_46938/m.109747 type:complete len:98 (-) Transcript_46938:2348-2641(-)